jgi:hypothetical protein
MLHDAALHYAGAASCSLLLLLAAAHLMLL